MKVVILAGGFGTRLSEYTGVVPKPMVEIGGKPIIWHIMTHYASYGFDEFIIAVGYKGHVIKEYFSGITSRLSDFSVDFGTGEISLINPPKIDWKVTLVDTGVQSMTGGRILRLGSLLADQPFMVTYGDGVSDLNITELTAFHRAHGKIGTITAVRPMARFGELQLKSDGLVSRFEEKPQTHKGWVNGGFMIFEPDIFEYLDDDSCVLEKRPLELLSSLNELMAFKHTGFWQCMDTKRDRDFLEGIYRGGEAPWAQ